MVNRTLRDSASAILCDALKGRVTLEDAERIMEEVWVTWEEARLKETPHVSPNPRDDPALTLFVQMMMVLQLLYGENRRLSGKRGLSSAHRQCAERFLLFLRSDEKYSVPVPEGIRLKSTRTNRSRFFASALFSYSISSSGDLLCLLKRSTWKPALKSYFGRQNHQRVRAKIMAIWENRLESETWPFADTKSLSGPAADAFRSEE